MASRSPFGGGGGGRPTMSFGLGGPPPRDVLILLAVVFVTFSLQFFQSTALFVALLRLTPFVWQRGYLWQLFTYPFIGTGAPGIWFLLELLILYWFGRDVRYQLRTRRFWTLLVGGGLAAGLIAVVVQILAGGLSPAIPALAAFPLVQGQRVLLTLLVAAFATLNGEATILLFFILPIRARWFLPLEILIGFMGFLQTHDLAGFLGICTAVAFAWLTLSRGGPRRQLRESRLRLDRWWIERRMARLRKKRGIHIVEGERGKGGPRIH